MLNKNESESLYLVTCPKWQCHVVVDIDGFIIAIEDVLVRFKGTKFSRLRAWLKKVEGVSVRQC